MDNTIRLNKSKKIKKNMILYVLGRLTSLFGTNIYSFAISLYILKVTGSAELFSVSLAIGMITKVVFSSYAGVISDKIDRKKIVVGSDIGCGLVLLILVGISYIDTMRISYILIATFFLSLLNVFFDIAMTSSLAKIADNDNLVKINSLNTSVSAITQIFAPIIGGIIYAVVEVKFFLLINAVSFIISGITEIFIDFNINEDIQLENNNENETGKESNGFKAGIKFIKENKLIGNIAIFSTVMNFLLQFGIVIPMPYIINNVLELSETRYGVIQSLFAIGMLIVGIALSVLPEKERNLNKIIIGLTGFILATLFMGIAIIPGKFNISKDVYFYLYAVLTTVISLSVPLINIPLFVKLQKIIPDHLKGRVFGVVTTIAGVIAPLGTLLSGLLVEAVPICLLPISSSAILLIVIVFLFSNKEMRKI